MFFGIFSKKVQNFPLFVSVFIFRFMCTFYFLTKQTSKNRPFRSGCFLSLVINRDFLLFLHFLL